MADVPVNTLPASSGQTRSSKVLRTDSTQASQLTISALLSLGSFTDIQGVAAPNQLPLATTGTPGAVIAGSGITIVSGTISTSGGTGGGGTGSVTAVIGGIGFLPGQTITTSGTLNIAPASDVVLGGVFVPGSPSAGGNLLVDSFGNISNPIASNLQLGVVRVDGLTITINPTTGVIGSIAGGSGTDVPNVPTTNTLTTSVDALVLNQGGPGGTTKQITIDQYNALTTIPVSSLTAAGSINATDLLAIDQGGTALVKATMTQIATYVGSSSIPPPSTAALGGVFSKAVVTNQFLTQVGTNGTVLSAQPSFSNLAGTIAASQLLPATGTSLGAVIQGSGISINAGGTISATGTAGVSSVIAGTGLAGGTITGTGTISLGTLGAGLLMGNPGTAGAVPTGVTLGTNLSFSGGTLNAAGGTGGSGVGSIVAAGMVTTNGTQGGTLSAAGTIGAIPIAQIADNTTTGGNARGSGAVDFQQSRTSATQVASANFSSILGGRNNVAASVDSVVMGNGANARATRQGGRYFAQGTFASNGDSQFGEFILRATGTGNGGSPAGNIQFTSDGSAVSTTNIINIGTNTAYAVRVQAVVVAADNSAAVSGNILYCVLLRGTGTAAAIGGTTMSTASSGTTTGSSWTLGADNSVNPPGLRLIFSMPNSQTQVWNGMALVQIAEILQ